MDMREVNTPEPPLGEVLLSREAEEEEGSRSSRRDMCGRKRVEVEYGRGAVVAGAAAEDTRSSSISTS